MSTWDYNEEKNKRSGRLWSIVAHSLLLILFLFLGMKAQEPPPEEQGIMISFGNVPSGSGKVQPKKINPPAKATPPPPAKTVEKIVETKVQPKPVVNTPPPPPPPKQVVAESVPQETANQELMASRVSEAAYIKQQKAKEEAEQKKREEERKQREQIERERKEAEERELAKLESEAREQQRIENERLAEIREQEEMVRLEQERVERERQEQERVERERQQQELARQEAERRERERIEAERAAAAAAEKARQESEMAQVDGFFSKNKGGNDSNSNNNSDGQGDGIYKGDQGNPNGGDNNGNNVGDRNTGLGDSGISTSIDGRTLVVAPKINDSSQKTGRVVIKIKVDKSGNVIGAELGKGSTTTDAYLVSKAKEASLKAKFNSEPGAPIVQTGTITYTFKVQ